MTDEELEKKAEAYADEHFEYTDFDCIDHDKWEDCQNSPAVDNKSGKDCQHDDKRGGKYD